MSATTILLILGVAWLFVLPILGVATGLVLRASRRATPVVRGDAPETQREEAPRALAEVA